MYVQMRVHTAVTCVYFEASLDFPADVLETERAWKSSEQKVRILRAFLTGALSLPSDRDFTEGLSLAMFHSVDLLVKNDFWFS